jgi:hypothetical protein
MFYSCKTAVFIVIISNSDTQFLLYSIELRSTYLHKSASLICWCVFQMASTQYWITRYCKIQGGRTS